VLRKLGILLLVMVVMMSIIGLSCKKPPVIPPEPEPDTTQTAPPPDTVTPPPPPPPALELNTIYFDYDKYNLTPQAQTILAANAKGLAMDDYAGVTIRIEGNCDERGSDEYNMALGEKRAATARDYLVNYGIDPKRISIISYGESRPVDPAHNEAAWAKNRRDDFVKVSE
jgi:peptidoglycan-associated lipoprotein